MPFLYTHINIRKWDCNEFLDNLTGPHNIKFGNHWYDLKYGEDI